ncbi:delta-1-pyrroline-5-carboxylate dehydrogenase, mitochondrial [Athene cunicularia]|uniref:delta-1-pyrroline-5-carboxylate dehydrogenase, mitochondrial n=1 Tax=Athene cunicularia TaxID=194338 RepID=UPI000EF6CD81|nr:delta-1-pyrroline-5-carboxylate dehydrogenase, mitochondrial [Athene cunicularia]
MLFGEFRLLLISELAFWHSVYLHCLLSGFPQPAQDFGTFFSAVIDDKSFARIKKWIEHAKNSSNLTILAGGGCDDSVGYFVEPCIVESKDPQDPIMKEEIFGPVLTVYVYPEQRYKEVLELIDTTTPYGLTGAVFAQEKRIIEEARELLRNAAGNFYINDKSTGAVVAQQPFGGSRISGTNDKPGGPHYILRWTSPQAIKETHVPLRDWRYAYMQ